MNREDFEWLVEHARSTWGDYMCGPPDLPIDQEEWNQWLEAGIVSQPETFDEVKVSKRGVSGRPWVSGYPPKFTVYRAKPRYSRQDKEEEMVVQRMVLYKLDFTKLLEYIAGAWGLRPDVGPTDLFLYRIGWRRGTELVAIYELNEYDGMYGDETMIAFKNKMDAEILYVITIGATYDLLCDIKGLAREGVVNIGSADFLTSEGKPIWDILSPRKPLTAHKDFGYSDGFRQIEWGGTRYTLTDFQAKAVSVLLDAYESGLPQVHQGRVLNRIGSKSKRLEHVFRRSPLWGTLIVRGDRKGLFQLKI